MRWNDCSRSSSTNPGADRSFVVAVVSDPPDLCAASLRATGLDGLFLAHSNRTLVSRKWMSCHIRLVFDLIEPQSAIRLLAVMPILLCHRAGSLSSRQSS